MNNPIIRPIKKEDNPFIAKMIRKVLVENGAPKVGTAYEDKTLDKMFETYQAARMEYFVVEENQKIIGAAGIAPLAGEEKSVCELQKMYFSAEARGRGIGAKMMDVCLNFARENSYKKCYLETLPTMKAAQKLYIKSGFQEIDYRMGTTGHFSCTVWMLKDL